MTEKPLFDVAHLRRVLEEATSSGAKWNARSLSLAASAGKSPHLVRDIIRGKSANPQLETILGIAKALGMDISQLVASAATLMPRVGMTGGAEQLEVVGAVAAGVWREQTNWAAEDRYLIEVGPNPVQGGERFALRMEGYSMDKIIPPGSDLECLRVTFGLVEPQLGDIVIVQRDRHDLHELTCKRLDHDGTNYILRAESTRAEFQDPMLVGKPDEDHIGDEGINIIGIVLRSHQNLYQRRR